MKDFQHLFHEELKTVYCVETEIQHLMPEMIKGARNPKLKELFETIGKEIPKQIERLEEIGRMMGVDFAVSECEAMKGLVRECKKTLNMHYLDQVLDAALISMLQKIKHYEIALYGVLKSFARHLKMKELEALLNESAKEEKQADKMLTDLAQGSLFGGGINSEACRRRSA